MFEILTGIRVAPIVKYVLDVRFEDSLLGATDFYDRITGRRFSSPGDSAGQVVNHPNLGRCFYFNGAAGLSLPEGEILDLSADDYEVIIDFLPDGELAGYLIYTGGEYGDGTHPGFWIVDNYAGGDYTLVESNVADQYRTIFQPISTTGHRTVSLKIGATSGTVFETSDGATIADPLAAPTGPTVVIGGSNGMNEFVPSFKGWIKSVRIKKI